MSRTTEALNKYYERQNRRQLRRYALAMGLNPDADPVEIAERFSTDDKAAFIEWRNAGGGYVGGSATSRRMGGNVEMPYGERQYIDPTMTDVHVDGILSAMSVQYRNEMYIADMVAPVVDVRKDSDLFYTYDQGDFMRDDMSPRAAGGTTAQAGYTLSTSPYAAIERAIETIVPHNIRDNQDNPLDADRDAVDFVTEKAMLSRERRVANQVTSISNVGSGNALSIPWSTISSSVPISDVRTGQHFIKQMTGKTANTLILSWPVMMAAIDHTDITARVQNVDVATAPRMRAALAGVFDVDRVLVGDAVYETGARGGTSSLSYIWGSSAILAYIEPTPRLRSVTGILSFAFKRRQIRRGVDTRNKFDWVQAEDFMDEQIVARNCIYTITGAG